MCSLGVSTYIIIQNLIPTQYRLYVQYVQITRVNLPNHQAHWLQYKRFSQLIRLVKQNLTSTQFQHIIVTENRSKLAYYSTSYVE